MLKIGLTGGIGSGKSAIARFLAELGAPVMDADKIAHGTYAPGGPAYEAVVAAFGKDILGADGTVDRAKLGSVVFKDPAALGRLTSIVWPATRERIAALMVEMREAGERKPIVVEAAILVEAKWEPLFDEVWLVSASREQVIARVERERGMKPAQIEARIKAQLPEAERRKHATLVIENDGSLPELQQKVAQVWSQALKRNG